MCARLIGFENAFRFEISTRVDEKEIGSVSCSVLKYFEAFLCSAAKRVDQDGQLPDDAKGGRLLAGRGLQAGEALQKTGSGKTRHFLHFSRQAPSRITQRAMSDTICDRSEC